MLSEPDWNFRWIIKTMDSVSFIAGKRWSAKRHRINDEDPIISIDMMDDAKAGSKSEMALATCQPHGPRTGFFAVGRSWASEECRSRAIREGAKSGGEKGRILASAARAGCFLS